MDDTPLPAADSALPRVLEMLELFNAADMSTNLGAIGAHFRDDATYQPLAPQSRVFHGKAAIVEELGRHALRYRNCICEVHAAAASRDHVFTERTDTVTQLRDGSTTVVQVVGVFEVDGDGLVRAWREYWDPVAAARQMGIAADDILAALGAAASSAT
ncbi:MAG: limonene,2-epoxide hydrolase [Frankiaceae bacterium]|nr:limonene,2-epoxide hydrolase [Frankiaceae bacterium]